MFSALALSWFLSIGYVPNQREIVGQSSVSLNSAKFATVAELGLRLDINRFSIYGGVENYQYFAEKVYFNPYRIDYKFGAEFRISKNVKLVFEHECDHPVNSKYYGAIGSVTEFDYLSSETQIKIVISGSNK